MLINPSHTLRFGKVPASLEKLHNQAKFSPDTREHAEYELKNVDATLQLIETLEETSKRLTELEQSGSLTKFDKGTKHFANHVAKNIIAGNLSILSRIGYLGGIEKVYQALKAQPNFAIKEGDPVYKVLAQIFTQFGDKAAK